ncbi:GH92 family glycosyl hydrolase [uncultured Mucilaginibacter sp.]|uniref:GH92 family glycosyl hydrolase n=1 Tax=uncultured Mucilaginibacter sp. TaxID=797541 RepID=UPI002607C55A|nr:GH92 family glycosyl hydrolase [uncultured Mucilaginibacter sp.]
MDQYFFNRISKKYQRFLSLLINPIHLPKHVFVANNCGLITLNTNPFNFFKQRMSIKKGMLILFLSAFFCGALAQNKVAWEIGKADHSDGDMALAPSNYKHFLDNDFGWEDRYFLIGFSNPKKDWPYVLPGPKDSWGGTAQNSGIRTQVLNILFGIAQIPANDNCNFTVNVLAYHDSLPPLVKVIINGKPFRFQLPKGDENNAIEGDLSHAKPYKIEIPITTGLLHKGGNEIQITTLKGSWLVFDQLKLEAPKDLILIKPTNVFLRNVKAADYEIEKNGRHYQPLLVDVQHLTGKPKLAVKLDGKLVFSETLDSARYEFEVPMPAVSAAKSSNYEIFSNNISIEKGKVQRAPHAVFSAADYVDTKLGSAHSRWMIAPGPWMPFSMVKISPDNQNSEWMGGYEPSYESIGTFSHIHEWTMAGLGMMPTSGPLKTIVGNEQHPEEGYRSQINKETEEAPLGYYKVLLADHNIKAELTATTRCSFQRYTYPKMTDARVMMDLKIPAEYDYALKEVSINKVSDYRIEGSSKQFSANVWAGGVDQEYTVHFVIEFDRPVKKFGTWVNQQVSDHDIVNVANPTNAGAFAEFDTNENQVVQVRTGISLVSIADARENLTTEVTQPFDWSFDKVRNAQKDTWNKLLGRLKISSNDRREKMRFYSNMFRALASRNTWSDVNGKWVDASKKVQQLKDPNSPALGCDAFWNTFWNLNQFWNLATPEWSSNWVKSQLAMYDANGWLAKGPAGMNYVPVMVAEHEIPLVVSVYQMGIRDYDPQKLFEAVHKMQTTPAQKVGNAGFAGNENLQVYLKYKYVPYDLGRFSNTLEYAYDDWTVAQLAKSLGKQTEYNLFTDRSAYWKNAIDKETGYARMKKSDGTWYPNFDPFRSGANEQYVEGNAWQLTYFVPQDLPGLIKTIGEKKFVDRLSWGFGQSFKNRFNAPGDQYWNNPVDQGNQQSMHFAYLFNWGKEPWLTQKWSRSVLDRYYGYGIANAYLGDEDQGQMSAWFIMSALGLFQTDGGANANPIYEIGSPIFPEVVIHLNHQYGRGDKFTIKANHVSRDNKYVQRATLNGKILQSFWFPAKELLKGGELTLEMGPQPNKNWGVK